MISIKYTVAGDRITTTWIRWSEYTSQMMGHVQFTASEFTSLLKDLDEHGSAIHFENVTPPETKA